MAESVYASLVEEFRHQNEVAVVIVNELSIITEVNDVFLAVLGFAREDIVGQPLMRIVPDHMLDAHHLGFARFVETGKARLLGQLLTMPVLHASGEILQAEICIEAWRENGEWTFGATIQPVS